MRWEMSWSTLEASGHAMLESEVATFHPCTTGPSDLCTSLCEGSGVWLCQSGRQGRSMLQSRRQADDSDAMT